MSTPEAAESVDFMQVINNLSQEFSAENAALRANLAIRDAQLAAARAQCVALAAQIDALKEPAPAPKGRKS